MLCMKIIYFQVLNYYSDYKFNFQYMIMYNKSNYLIDSYKKLKNAKTSMSLRLYLFINRLIKFTYKVTHTTFSCL